MHLMLAPNRMTQYQMRLTMDFREREPYTHAHTHARCVSFVYSAWREAGGAALGLSYVPPKAHGG